MKKQQILWVSLGAIALGSGVWWHIHAQNQQKQNDIKQIKLLVTTNPYLQKTSPDTLQAVLEQLNALEVHSILRVLKAKEDTPEMQAAASALNKRAFTVLGTYIAS